MTSKKVSPRVTVGHYELRAEAQRDLEREQERHPGVDLELSISGRQGSWKLRRVRLPTDPR